MTDFKALKNFEREFDDFTIFHQNLNWREHLSPASVKHVSYKRQVGLKIANTAHVEIK